MANVPDYALVDGERVERLYDADIQPIPDLADWPMEALRENLAIYQAEPEDDWQRYRVNELSAEIKRREAIVNEINERLELLRRETNGTLSTDYPSVCPTLTIQFGDIGGITLAEWPLVEGVLVAIENLLAQNGHTDLASHARNLLDTGLAPNQGNN